MNKRFFWQNGVKEVLVLEADEKNVSYIWNGRIIVESKEAFEEDYYKTPQEAINAELEFTKNSIEEIRESARYDIENLARKIDSLDNELTKLNFKNEN